MGLLLRYSKSKPRLSLRWILSHLFISFTISAVYNTHEISAERVVAPNALGEFEYVDTDDLKVDFPETYNSTTRNSPATPLPPSTLAPPTSRPTPRRSHDDPRDQYKKFMSNSLGEDDLEYSLDYYNEKVLVKEYDFNPVDLVNKLADSAIAHSTSPIQFLEEIQDLISLQNRSRTESNEGVVAREEVSQLTPGFLSENLLKRMTEGWKNELKRLEKKYNVSSECTGQESITATRLALMFPHYLNFGQKPFSALSDISVSIIRDYNSYNYDVPKIFQYPEFGGLIPPEGYFSRSTRRSIILVHLYLMHRHDQNDAVPFRTKCMMLKLRMEKSALSYDRRLRFFINNDIVDKYGALLRTSIETMGDSIPSDFKNKIDWDLLESSSSSSRPLMGRYQPGTTGQSTFYYIPQRG